MAKRGRRVPRYLREDPAWCEAEKLRKAGIPSDAVPADLSQQAPNNSYGPPCYYRDYDFTCVDCGSFQVWRQQKWWYEVAKGSIYSVAMRCCACRAGRRGTPPRSQAEGEQKADA